MNNIDSLDRFLTAQENMYPRALNEIRCGRKRSHWMWYIFPQLRALGKSAKAYCFGIANGEEARAYLAHPVLSARLLEITNALLALDTNDAVHIFGDIDAVKLRSSMTLFALVAPSEVSFQLVLDKFFGGEKDPITLQLAENNYFI